MALSNMDKEWIEELLDAKLSTHAERQSDRFDSSLADLAATVGGIRSELGGLSGKLDTLTEAVKLLLYNNPRLWQFSPFEDDIRTFVPPRQQAGR